MNACRIADEDLFRFSQGDLPLGRSLWVSSHVVRCAACQARIKEFRHVSDLLGTSLRGGPPFRPNFRRVTWPKIAALFLAGVSSMAFIAWRHSESPVPANPKRAARINLMPPACELLPYAFPYSHRPIPKPHRSRPVRSAPRAFRNHNINR